MFYYCLFCLQRRVTVIETILQNYMPSARIISPKWIQLKWVKGTAFEEDHALFPGYLFIYTDEQITDFRSIMTIEGVIRFLGSRDDGFLLHNEDLRFAQMLAECEGRIGNFKVYQVGDRIHLAKGVLAGFDGQIVKVDRHRRRLQVEFGFDNAIRRITVGYEMLEQENTSIPLNLPNDEDNN